jgi:hypothetical protein
VPFPPTPEMLRNGFRMTAPISDFKNIMGIADHISKSIFDRVWPDSGCGAREPTGQPCTCACGGCIIFLSVRLSSFMFVCLYVCMYIFLYGLVVLCLSVRLSMLSLLQHPFNTIVALL